MKLRNVGFFKELSYGDPSGPSLEESVSEPSNIPIAQVVSYLHSGVACIVSPGISKDVLSPHRDVIGPLALLTDGKFLWPSDLSYYVAKYHVRIPDDFLDQMSLNNWKVPIVDLSVLEM